ncbi:MAG: hypothetical protein WBV55_24715 [Candidatus Sulfotelmatobacter sp.]
MPYSLEYHKTVNHILRRLIPASLASFAVFLFPLFAFSSSPAQVGGVSPGSIHSVPVAPPTAIRVPPPTASLVPPPTGALPVHSAFAPSAFAHPTGISHPHRPPQDNGHHPQHNTNSVAVYPYPYPVPYGADVSDSNTAGQDDDAAEYQAGPAIGDPRSYGADAYVRPLPVDPSYNVSAESNLADPPVSDPPDSRQPPTTLVFKDGHQLQLNNYAIVSQTLYDFTPGHPRKISLSDLDLPATQKQNDDHGVVFELPPSSQTN